jgi:hypothetical protein
VIVIASFVAGKVARDAILLARFDVTSLPIFIAIAAVISLPIIFVTGRLLARYGPAYLIPAVNLVSAGMSLGEWLLLERAPQLIAVIVFFHLATSGSVLVSGFWSIVNERFDVQTAKRHIARIGIGATLGGIFGGVIAERAAVHLAPDAILLVLAGLQAVCAVALYLFARAPRRQPAVLRSEETWLALRSIRRSPLLLQIGGVVVLVAVAGGVMDYVFKADIVHSSTHDGLQRSLAIFYTATSVITAIVQLALCGPLIARLGVPRSVGTLPATVAAFGLFSLALPIPLAAAIARGAEIVTRNSIFRAGYELIYAPLPEDQKRPVKVMLDVGADRIGDLFGAQLVALIVYAMAEPRLGLLVATVAVGALATLLAIRLPRSYTAALEDSLMAHADPTSPPAAADEPQPWITMTGLPSLGQAGEFAPLSLRLRDRRAGKPPREPAAAPPARARNGRAAHAAGADRTLERIADLRSGDTERILRALACGLPPELAPHALELVGRDDVARAAITALSAAAPHSTGLLVDALLDPARDVALRRRLPAVLLSGEPALATWGLWRALGDPSFDVRYRAGAVLSRLAAAGKLQGISSEDVFEAVRRELVADRGELAGRRVIDDLATADPAADPLAADEPVQRASAGLEHVFTVLGLALPAEPLRIALHAVQTDDPELRGTALEYLESILPPDVRAQLWPLLDGDLAPHPAHAPVAARSTAPHPAPQLARDAEARVRRTHDEMVAALHLSYPRVLDKLRQRVKPA